jgi:hypothetical protein
VNYLHCPAGEQEWDNPNWSNQPEFAVGCGRNSAGQAHAIYAIDLDKKSYQQVVTGTELQEPYLWIGFLVPNPSNFALDSIGRYNDPSAYFFQAILATKFLMFWRLFDSLEVIVIGSSHALEGIDQRKIVGLRAFNMAANGCDLPGQKAIILNYVVRHCTNIKLICSSLDFYWFERPDGNYSWNGALGQSKGYLYDSCHAFWPGGISSNFKDIIRQIPIPYPTDTLNFGFDSVICQGWGDSLPPHDIPPDWTIADINYQKSYATIAMLADTLRLRGIHWIMVNFPVSPHYKNYPNYYSYWGPSWQTARDVLQQIRSLEASNRFFHLYDANNDGNNDYGDEYASDYDHLCGAGAEKLTDSLNKLIDSILK